MDRIVLAAARELAHLKIFHLVALGTAGRVLVTTKFTQKELAC